MHDEWIAFPRRYLPEGSMDELYRERPDSAPALPQHHRHDRQLIHNTTTMGMILWGAVWHDTTAHPATGRPAARLM
ncbi:hypothetical protein ABZ532_30330 [Streptomyces sp. NPDC019396]|uniref:hypothetical protein n=1 Tax=Streptomyces sp. NPDC019396 TaxID=3154687 RepID=UPI0033F177FA